MTSPSLSDHSRNIRLPNEGAAALGEFALAPDLIHLNHGSYGAIPRAVQAEQDRLRALVERDPTGFFQNIYPGEVRRAAGVAARCFGGDASDWVFCENATAAVSSVLASFPLESGDEILTTSHGYGAVVKAMRLWGQRKGATLKIAPVPVIVEDESQVVESIVHAFTERTRLLVIDHITSPSAIVFPVKQIVKAAHDAGIAVLVDGAHAPGHVELDVPAVCADWYTGNAHKWFFAPRGCGLLWTARKWQAVTRPAVLSHGTEESYTAAFDWIGTRDATPWLCLGTAAEAFDRFGAAHLMVRNRALAAEGAEVVIRAFGGRVSAPSVMRGAMASVCARSGEDAAESGQRLRRALRECGIVVAAGAIHDHIYFRLSAQIYSTLQDFESCAKALTELGFGAAKARRSAPNGLF
jgi:isopenicillin-N epimerase